MPVEDMPDELCRQASEYVAAQLGLHFPPERYGDLRRALHGAAMELGFTEPARFAGWLVSNPVSPEQLHTLAGHLTVGETYFFRDRAILDALSEHVLPELIRARRGEARRLRIWSTACSTGEEPYSLAILLQQLLPDWQDWQITILATDINEKALRTAAAGVYGRWSFRNCPAGLQQRYFTRVGEERFELGADIRGLVTFAHTNLAKDGFPSLAGGTGGMDLILCRNLLIYFTAAQAEVLVERLRCALTDGGWLVVGPSECSQTLFARFDTVNFPGAILYRKGKEEEKGFWGPAAPGLEQELFAEAHALFAAAALMAPTPQDTAETHALKSASVPASAEARPLVAASMLTTPTPQQPAQTLALTTRNLANEGRLTEARAASERWLLADKLDPSAHYLHATITQELGDTTTARRSLQRSIFLQPDFALGHFALGNLARSESRHADAKRHFETALRVLRNQPPDEVLPESDGMTASQLAELVATLLAAPTQVTRVPAHCLE